MNLNILWFILIAVLYAGFFFLEGFDFGVGMLLPIIGKKDVERRAIINTIGPHWDGNEVWLIVAGGATFAAFPHWYATLFSGFYLGMFLLLLALIVRGVALEFRSKIASPKWRFGWDWAIAIASFLASFLLGVVFTNLVRGVPIDANMQYTGTFLTLLNPVSLLGGLAVVFVFIFHGANFLSLKLIEGLRVKAHNAAVRNFPAALIFAVGLFGALYFTDSAFSEKGALTLVLPLLAAAALVLSRVLSGQKKEGWAFILSSAAVVFMVAAIFIALFPNVMISSTDVANNLTIHNASSSPYTLKVMSIVAAVMLPIVLAYQVWTYWMFRKRVKADPKSLTY
ncbi:MAG: cytochrome d ubiquinol oxidase subunit II [Anaerolineaceae bacterium]|nr:cytochrome d ubiquinol oxidase subunit II [Anaerolineaceae bacterium]